MKSIGKGNKPRAADPIIDEELEEMYSTKVLGPDTPSSLQCSMWIICTLHFGMRTGKETHDLKWADIQLKSDAEGQEYLVNSLERQTKTQTGMNPRDVRPTKPRAYAVPECPEKDPLHYINNIKSIDQQTC